MGEGRKCGDGKDYEDSNFKMTTWFYCLEKGNRGFQSRKKNLH